MVVVGLLRVLLLYKHEPLKCPGPPKQTVWAGQQQPACVMAVLNRLS